MNTSTQILPKVNKTGMAWMIVAIKEYFISCHDSIRAPLAYIIWKTTIVQTSDDFPRYATHFNRMITRMLHSSLDKNKLLIE